MHHIEFCYANSLAKENIKPEFFQQEHCYYTLRFECNGLSADFPLFLASYLNTNIIKIARWVAKNKFVSVHDRFGIISNSQILVYSF